MAVDNSRLESDSLQLLKSLGELPKPVLKPFFIVISGLPGTGKSFVGRELSLKLPVVHVESDSCRKLLFEKPKYSGNESNYLFRAIRNVIASLLSKRIPVILDATNLSERNREALNRIAKNQKVKFILAHISAPAEIVKKRLQAREKGKQTSDADWMVYKKLALTEDKIKSRHFEIDTSSDITPVVDNIVRAALQQDKDTGEMEKQLDIKVKTGSIQKTRADAVVVGIFEGIKRPRGVLSTINKSLGGAVTKLIRAGEVKGKISEVTTIYTLGRITADRLIMIGLGKKSELNEDKIRIATASVCQALQGKGIKKVVITPLGADTGKISIQAAANAMAEGAALGLYTFRKHITSGNDKNTLEQLTIMDRSHAAMAAMQAAVDEGIICANATNSARDMVNEPANYMTPLKMAEEARRVADENKLDITVLEREEMEKLGMGALLAVAQGSHEPPKFIILKYNGTAGKNIGLALVGKSITFDSGGISIKPSEGMGDMKGDMAGGASVIAAMSAIAKLKPKINIVAIAAATENLPGGKAFKPADVLTAMNGKTIEVISTDAEGRLTLADAICYANKLGAKRIVDIATLTGGCVVALGNVATGAFTNNQPLLDKVMEASAQTGDKIWQLPTFEEYKEQNKSDVADIKNSGGREASPITAALFVGEFAGDTPWVHLDIAGTSDLSKPRGYYGTKFATGVPTRTLIRLALSLAGSARAEK